MATHMEGEISDYSAKFYDGTYKWNTDGFEDDNGGNTLFVTFSKTRLWQLNACKCTEHSTPTILVPELLLLIRQRFRSPIMKRTKADAMIDSLMLPIARISFHVHQSHLIRQCSPAT